MSIMQNTSKSGYVLKASGPERPGCHALPEIRPARFHKLGGQDIVVWGTRYTVEADTLAAIDYAIARLGLEVDTIQTPNEILDETEYAAFKARGGRG
jgi:hypothetical protein